MAELLPACQPQRAAPRVQQVQAQRQRRVLGPPDAAERRVPKLDNIFGRRKVVEAVECDEDLQENLEQTSTSFAGNDVITSTHGVDHFTLWGPPPPKFPLLSLFYDRRSSAGISGQHSIFLFLLPHKNVTLFFSGRFILLRGKRFPDHYASFLGFLSLPLSRKFFVF